MTQDPVSGVPAKATQGTEAYERGEKPVVVGGSVDLDGAHEVGAGQRRQRRQMVQFGG